GLTALGFHAHIVVLLPLGLELARDLRKRDTHAVQFRRHDNSADISPFVCPERAFPRPGKQAGVCHALDLNAPVVSVDIPKSVSELRKNVGRSRGHECSLPYSALNYRVIFAYFKEVAAR